MRVLPDVGLRDCLVHGLTPEFMAYSGDWGVDFDKFLALRLPQSTAELAPNIVRQAPSKVLIKR